ncbi:MAG: hypothetical protein WD942_11190 [Dehalococcoidia bacterium]
MFGRARTPRSVHPPSLLVALLTALPLSQAVAQHACDWSIDEVHTFGSTDGPLAFSPILDLTMGPDALLYVAQQFVPEVWVLDLEGRIVERIGRSGGGPGEFDGSPVRLGFKGDTLWVTDYTRLTFFSPTGKPLRRVSYSHLVPGEGSVFLPGHPLADGTYLGRRTLRGREMIAYARARRLPLLRFSGGGEIVDTLAVVAKGPNVIREPGFSEHPLWEWDWMGASMLPVAVGPHGLHVTYTVHGGTDWFDLIRLDLHGDTLLRSRVRYEPRQISTEAAEWLKASFAANAAGDYLPDPPSSSRDDAARERDRRAAYEALTLPEHFPPVRKIVMGSDSSIWILRELRPPELVDRWEVYTPQGVHEGTVVFSEGRGGVVPWAPRLELIYASEDWVWGTTVSDLDIPVLKGYRVDRSCSAR